MKSIFCNWANCSLIENKDKGYWIEADSTSHYPNPIICNHCGVPSTKEGYDQCIGFVPNCSNGCCNHGGESHGLYLQFWDGSIIRDQDVVKYIQYLQKIGEYQKDIEFSKNEKGEWYVHVKQDQ